MMAATVCKRCKSALKPGASVCAACEHVRLTIADTLWTIITAAAIFGGIIGFAWLLGALF
jgi:hypothetical protein